MTAIKRLFQEEDTSRVDDVAFSANDLNRDWYRSSSIDTGNHFTIVIENSIGGKIPDRFPRELKKELIEKIGDVTYEFLRMTRNGRLIIVTSDIEAAAKLVQLDSLHGTPVKATLKIENISTRFLVFNIPTDIAVEEVITEL